MFIKGMLGLGDNLYQRAILKQMGPLMLETSWPQLYVDLPIKCIRPNTRLRTQAKNAARSGALFHKHFLGPDMRMAYDHTGTLIDGLMRSVRVNFPTLDFTGPPVAPVPRSGYVVVRPVTLRKEWMAEARNPHPEYLLQASEALAAQGYTVISVADLRKDEEWAVEPLPFAHEQFHRGELAVEELLALVAGAAGVVGGVGWLAPAAVAYGVPLLVVYGGWGAANRPQRLFDKRMGATLVRHALPDPLCLCSDRAHNCPRTIHNFGEHLADFIQLLATREASVAS